MRSRRGMRDLGRIAGRKRVVELLVQHAIGLGLVFILSKLPVQASMSASATAPLVLSVERELEVDPAEELPPRHAIAVAPDGVLRLEEGVDRGLAELPDLAGAEADRDVVDVVL